MQFYNREHERAVGKVICYMMSCRMSMSPTLMFALTHAATPQHTISVTLRYSAVKKDANFV